MSKASHSLNSGLFKGTHPKANAQGMTLIEVALILLLGTLMFTPN